MQLTVDKVLLLAGKGPFDVKGAFSCFTADVISQYAFGGPMGFIAQDGRLEVELHYLGLVFLPKRVYDET